MSTNLGYAGKLLTNAAGKVLSFGGAVTPPVVLPTPQPPAITAENDAAQTITFSVPGGLGFDQVRYEVAGAGPFTPTNLTVQFSPSTSYLPGAIVFYVAGIDGVRNESQRVSNTTTLAAEAAPINTNPAAPTLVADDSANTLTVSSSYALSELEQRITDSGAVSALPALVTQVGNVAHAEAYYQIRVKAASGRNASPFARSAAFTVAPIQGGAPAGFTGPVGPGYAAAGDTRIKTDLHDNEANGWIYSGPWLIDTNGLYWNGTLHYITSFGTASITYFGGGFTVVSHTGGFCDADIWVDGAYHSTVSYFSANGDAFHDLATIVLPEAQHTVEFRYKAVTNRNILVHDGIRLTPKP